MSKSLQSLLQNVDVLRSRGDLNVVITGLAQDSRKVREGDLFIALPGARQDGHQFIADAIQRGARAVLTQHPVPNGLPTHQVLVSDSRKALATLAANFYEHPAEHLRLIGITGTNGKTTTSLLLESVLRQGGCSVGVIGTLAYRWGNTAQKAPLTTPDPLELNRLFHLMRQDGVTHVVMEVSSHALGLGRVEGLQFQSAIFTNLSQDHLDFHHDMEQYFAAKGLLFTEHLRHPSGFSAAVINRDDPFGQRLLHMVGRAAWSYSLNHQDATVWVRSTEFTTAEIRAELATPRGALQVRSALLGRLNLYNLLAAATSALALGIPLEAIALGLEQVSYVDGRLQRVPIPEHFGFEVIVDFAHTPDAMEKSLSCLKEMTRGRLIVVFGCGGDRDRGKRPIMGEVGARLGDLVILTSDNPRSEAPEAIIRDIEPGVLAAGLKPISQEMPTPDRRGYLIQPDRKKAIELALSLAAAGDMIFIGGKGHETYQILADRTISFDDRVVVRDFVEKMGPGPTGSKRQ